MIDFLTDVLTDNYQFFENSVNLYPFHLCILHFNNSRADFFNMFYGIIEKKKIYSYCTGIYNYSYCH